MVAMTRPVCCHRVESVSPSLSQPVAVPLVVAGPSNITNIRSRNRNMSPGTRHPRCLSKKRSWQPKPATCLTIKWGLPRGIRINTSRHSIVSCVMKASNFSVGPSRNSARTLIWWNRATRQSIPMSVLLPSSAYFPSSPIPSSADVMRLPCPSTLAWSNNPDSRCRSTDTLCRVSGRFAELAFVRHALTRRSDGKTPHV